MSTEKHDPTCIIFDIDGSIANCDHRVHHVRNKPKNWKEFKKGIPNDTVYHDIIWMLKTFASQGIIILIATGRDEDDREATEIWLRDVAKIDGIYSKLYMKKANDFRPDTVTKLEMLKKMREDGFNPTIALDDRPSVIKLWRDQGLTTLAVGPLEHF